MYNYHSCGIFSFSASGDYINRFLPLKNGGNTDTNLGNQVFCK